VADGSPSCKEEEERWLTLAGKLGGRPDAAIEQSEFKVGYLLANLRAGLKQT
jgi:hypothetical protein